MAYHNFTEQISRNALRPVVIVDAPHNEFESTSFLCVFPSLRELLFALVMNDSCVTNLRHALPYGVSYEEIKVSRKRAKTQRGEESICGPSAHKQPMIATSPGYHGLCPTVRPTHLWAESDQNCTIGAKSLIWKRILDFTRFCVCPNFPATC